MLGRPRNNRRMAYRWSVNAVAIEKTLVKTEIFGLFPGGNHARLDKHGWTGAGGPSKIRSASAILPTPARNVVVRINRLECPVNILPRPLPHSTGVSKSTLSPTSPGGSFAPTTTELPNRSTRGGPDGR